ncbi:MAG TPA: MBL fold metallo-hydrolase [Candidatus Dormibacteraeota bacterium]|nr:MBL fold metallo-hydrolase [Candidatus Dormibacteraeota bacterium]
MRDVEILTIETPGLGDRSYLATDGRVALAIDPQRDIDRVIGLLASRSLRLTHVFETHIHNDYLTGGLALARATGAAYHVNESDSVSFARVPLAGGDVVQVGASMTVRAIATPGHTHSHLAYALTSPAGPPALFTGGSLLFGSVGRPDLLGPAHAMELAHAQYASAHLLAGQVPDDARLYPTHGFGSLCSAGPAGAAGSTLGAERLHNPVFAEDEEEYVESLLAGLDAYPAYYAHMAPGNLEGPGVPDLTPPSPADAGELRRRLAADEWVVDLRARRAFARGHVAGTLNIGIDGSLATYLGWLIPWGTPLSLLGDTRDQVAEGQRELSRIGLERIASSAAGSPLSWAGGAPLASYPVADLADLAAVIRHRRVIVLDVRQRGEWSRNHVEGSFHIPIQELPDRVEEVPAGEVWVHCGAGYRAAIAASILETGRRQVVLIDDGFDRAAEVGVPLAGTEAPAAD